MFVSVARLTLQIPESGSLKAKRQVLRRITDRLKARFNASIAEVEDQDLWQKAGVAFAVVSASKRHAEEQIEKIIHFVEETYVAPLISRQMETIALGDELYEEGLPVSLGHRSLAEAEGLGEWQDRHAQDPARKERPAPAPQKAPKLSKKLSLEEARARARSLRNPREWEKP